MITHLIEKNHPFFANQTQTVANPFHIKVDFAPTTPFAQTKYLSPKILTHHPFCTSWFFPSVSYYLSAIWSVTTSSNTQNTLLHNSSLQWKLVSHTPCVVLYYLIPHLIVAKHIILYYAYNMRLQKQCWQWQYRGKSIPIHNYTHGARLSTPAPSILEH